MGSVMKRDLRSFADAFDDAFIHVQDLHRGMNQGIPIFMFSVPKQVFDIISRRKRATKRRLAIDAAATRDAYRRFEIKRVSFVCREQCPAKLLSKIHHIGMLHKLVNNNKDVSTA